MLIYNHYFKNFNEFNHIFKLYKSTRTDGTTYSTRQNNIAFQSYMFAIRNKQTDAFVDIFRTAGHIEHFETYITKRIFNAAQTDVISDVYKIDHLQSANKSGLIVAKNKQTGKIQSMKCGKFIRTILKEHKIDKIIGDVAVNYYCEHFTEKHKSKYIYDDATLTVDDDFDTIYERHEGFDSCMSNMGFEGFYSYSVEAQAASLSEDGRIIARCVIFTNVEDENGEVYRLAERQYGVNNVAKITLINKLIKEGHIDGYKQTDSNHTDRMAFVLNNGEDLYDTPLRISCNLSSDDYVSYQDSFVYLDELDGGYAYNYNEWNGYPINDNEYRLDVTDGVITGLFYDELLEDYTSGEVYTYDLFEGGTLSTVLDSYDIREYGYEYSKYHEKYSAQYIYSELMDDCIDGDDRYAIEQEYMEDHDYPYDEYNQEYTEEELFVVYKLYERGDGVSAYELLHTVESNLYDFEEVDGIYIDEMDEDAFIQLKRELQDNIA